MLNLTGHLGKVKCSSAWQWHLETIYYVKMIKSPSFMVRSLSTTLKWKWKENICYQENICVAGCGADVGQWSILTNVLDVKHCRVSRNSNNNRNNSSNDMEMAIVPWPHNNKTNTDKTSACYLCMLYVLCNYYHCCMCNVNLLFPANKANNRIMWSSGRNQEPSKHCSLEIKTRQALSLYHKCNK